MRLQMSPTCLCMTASFRNKCSKRSDRLLKMVCKSSRKRDLLAIQSLNQYHLRLLLVNRLYTIMATIAAFWFTLCRHSNCNCPAVNILKICKEMVWLWKASFLYAFVLIENRSTVSHLPVTAQLQPVTNHSPTGLNRSQAYRGMPIGCVVLRLNVQVNNFQSCRDGAMASWVINQYFQGVKCLAQGHNTAAVGFEPQISRSGVWHSTTEPPRSPVADRSLINRWQVAKPVADWSAIINSFRIRALRSHRSPVSCNEIDPEQVALRSQPKCDWCLSWWIPTIHSLLTTWLFNTFITCLVLRSHNFIDLPADRRWELEHLHMEWTGPLSAFHLLK